MALKRSMLKGMGLTEEQIDSIIEAHTETVSALKDERDEKNKEIDSLKKDIDDLKAEAGKTKDLEAKIDELEKANAKNEEFKEKYETTKKEYDDYKANVENETVNRNKSDALKAMLKEIGVSDKHVDTVLKVSDISAISLDKDGKIEKADELKENLKTEWSDFIVTEGTKGAKTETPPTNNGGSKMSKEEIMKIADRNERQKAISENHELFGY